MSDLSDLLDDEGDTLPLEPGSPLAKVEKAAIGCFSCAVISSSGIGAVLGVGAGGLYHALLAPEGWLAVHLAAGALLGLLAGARLLIPVEELAIDFLLETISGVFSRKKKRGPGGHSDLPRAS